MYVDFTKETIEMNHGKDFLDGVDVGGQLFPFDSPQRRLLDTLVQIHHGGIDGFL